MDILINCECGGTLEAISDYDAYCTCCNANYSILQDPVTGEVEYVRVFDDEADYNEEELFGEADDI